MPEVKISIDLSGVRQAALRAADLTMAALHSDVISSQIVPFDNGDEQQSIYESLAEDYGDSIIASLESPSPQSRRQYYHPEYNYQTVNNPNARGDWTDVYTEGEKKGFMEKTFAESLREELGQ
jgi:hypothetical protein